MKSALGIIVAILLVGAGVWYAGQDTKKEEDSRELQGSIVFGITDAAADIKNVSDIHMTVSKIEVRSTADTWVTVSSEPKTYELLDLKASGDVVLAGWSNLAAGTYDQVRLTVDKVEIEAKNGTRTEAKLPSGELKLMQEVTVAANATSTISLDFLGDKSLHVTGNGKYIFSPVVKADVWEGTEVMVEGEDKLKVQGGSMKSSATFGMDLNGEIKKDFQIKADAKIELDAAGEIKLPPGLLKIETGTSGNATSAASVKKNAVDIQSTTTGGVKVKIENLVQ